MNVPAVLVRLYPPAIRGRWGYEIAHEAGVAGPRSWFDTVLGAGKLWLHPSDWPEPAPGQTSRVLVTAFSAVVVAAGMLMRALGSGLPVGSGGWGVAGAWLAPFVAGLVLSVPLPPLTGGALVRLLAVGARTLALPTLAGAALVLAAHSGIADHVTGLGHVALVISYWGTGAFAGICLCRLVARIGRIAVVPSVRRLRFALLCGGAGLVLAAGQVAFVAGSAGSRPGTVALSCGLAALGAVVLVVGRDLRRIRSRAQPRNG